MEKSMETHEDDSVLHFLNGLDNQQTALSNVTGNELLAFTNAAVKALKPEASYINDPGNSYPLSMMNGEIHVISPNVSTSFGDLGTNSSFHGDSLPQNELAGSRNLSRSSTASDILIRSTIVDPDEGANNPMLLDLSQVSRISVKSTSSSQASSAFLNGSARRVKVSSKKLREIKSPFESGMTEKSADKTTPRDGLPNTATGQNHVTNINGQNPSSYNPVDAAVKNVIANGELEVRTKKNISNSKEDLNHSMTKGHKVVVEKHRKGDTSKRDVEDPTHVSAEASKEFNEATEKGCAGTDLEKKPFTTTSGSTDTQSAGLKDTGYQTLSRKDTSSASDGDATEESSSCEQPEIETVQERIVTVQAVDQREAPSSDSSTSDVSLHSALRQNRFAKLSSYAPTLRQGDLQGGKISESSRNTDDVYISKFDLSEKQRLLKQSFVGRQQQHGPVKKVVHPKIVGSMEDQKGSKKSQDAAGDATDAVTTAAVAASAAVAATQPFLKAQQDLETRMALILERLATLQAQQQRQELAPPSEGHRSDRIVELEKQIGDLTQKRLDYLEKMQQQQMDWQANLLAISRRPHAVLTPGGREVKQSKYQHSGVHLSPKTSTTQGPGGETRVGYLPAQAYQPKSKAFTKTVVDDSERVFGKPGSTGQQSQSRERDQNVLDTPAPRRKPPVPTSYEASQELKVKDQLNTTPPTRDTPFKSGTLLEQILASQDETLREPPFPPTPVDTQLSNQRSRLNDSPSTSSEKRYNRRLGNVLGPETIQKAEGLVQDLGDLRHQVEHVMQDAAHLKTEALRRAQASRSSSPGQTYKQEPLVHQAFPLDQYLVKPSVAVPASPYPGLKGPDKGDAPVVNNYSDAKHVLEQVQRSKNYLESNLDTILRSRHNDEVYAFIDDITRDSSMAERKRIKKMVDGWISSMNRDLEMEILEEMARLEECKKRPIYQAERDVAKVKPGVKGIKKGKVEAKINTGLKKVKKEDGPATRPTSSGRENVLPKTRQPVKSGKGKVLLKNEEYMTRVYGKAMYQGQRSTQKDPYLRYQSTSPKAKLPRPAATVQVKGVEMQSEKTQTAFKTAKPGKLDHYYFDPAATRGQQLPTGPHPAMTGPLQGQLIPMAIPLGAPRQEGGIPVQYPTIAPSGPPMTSTPVASPQVEPPARPVYEETDGKKQDIPVYEEEPEETKEEAEVTEEEEEEEEEDPGSEPIKLPGYKQKSGQYHGPAFPPRAPPIHGENLTSDVLAADLRRRDMLENKAMDWIEQELMARIISEMTLRRAQEAPPGVTTKNRPHVPEDSVASDDASEASVNVETIGRDGLQLFVDAGHAVDDRLVNALIKEVISEKLVGMVGQRTASDDEQMKPDLPAPKPQQQSAPAPSQPRPVSPAQHHTVPTPVPTPKATPRGSPVVTPVRQVSPPPTPEVTPPVSEMTGPPAVESEAEVESLVEEASPVIPAVKEPVPQREPQVPFVSRHDVDTPPVTPPPTPPRVLTPMVSIEPSPEPSIHEEVKEPPPKPPTPREPTPPPEEPQPWGNPDSPLPEENPAYEEEVTPKDPQKPVVMSVAMDEEPEVLEQGVQVSMHEPAPPVEEKQELSESETVSSTANSSISDTMNECISEGQWLLNRSEGELPPLAIDPVLREQIRAKYDDPGDQDVSVASTLHGTEELLSDAENNGTHSEGEFLHKARIPPDRDPVLALLTKIQEPVLYPGLALRQPTAPVAFAPGTQVDASLGEVSWGQRPEMTAPAESVLFGHSQMMQPVDAQALIQQKTSLAQQQFTVTQQQPSFPQQQRGNMQAGVTAVGVGATVTSMTTATSQAKPSTTADLEHGNRDTAPTRAPAQAADGQTHSGDTDQGAAPQQEVQQTVQTRPRTPDRRGRPISSPVNVMQGGMMAGGRPKSARGRPAPGRQGVRGQMTSPMRSESPELRSGGGRVIQVVESSQEEPDLRGTMDSEPDMQGTRTMSDGGTRNMTPDQMNVDALLHSGNYLSQTFSSQSEGGQTGQFNQSGHLTQTLGSMDDARNTGELRQSQRLTYTLEGSDSTNKSGQVTGNLRRSADLGRSNSAGTSGEFGQTGTLRGSGEFGQTGLMRGSREFDQTATMRDSREFGQTGSMRGSGEFAQTGTLRGSGEFGQTGTMHGSREFGQTGTMRGSREFGETGTLRGSREFGQSGILRNSRELRQSGTMGSSTEWGQSETLGSSFQSGTISYNVGSTGRSERSVTFEEGFGSSDFDEELARLSYTASSGGGIGRSREFGARTLDSSQEMRQSGQYSNASDRGSGNSRSGQLTVSVTIPSAANTESGSEHEDTL